MVAESGDNTAERPMWAEKGGLDFDGRAKWDAWTALKGMNSDKAKLQFVQVGSTECAISSPDCNAHLLLNDSRKHLTLDTDTWCL